MEGFRSVPMAKVRLFLPLDSVRETMNELGRLSIVQFIDLNDTRPTQRRFYSEIRACDEMERQIRYFANTIKSHEIEVAVTAKKETDEGKFKLEDVQTQLEYQERELKEVISNHEQLVRSQSQLEEQEAVLAAADKYFGEIGPLTASSAERSPLLDDSARSTPQREIAESPLLTQTLVSQSDGISRTSVLGTVAGVVLAQYRAPFQKLLWRATHGNVTLYFAPTERYFKDAATGNQLEKNIFVVMFSGQVSRKKVEKICESFHANVYPCPEGSLERVQEHDVVKERLRDLSRVLEASEDHVSAQLEALSLNLECWNAMVKKEKALCHTMNMFNTAARNALVAEAWVPEDEVETVYRALRTASARCNAQVPSVLTRIEMKDTPPTLFRTNEFTKGIQNIVDAYGVPRYREANPALITAMTFPFLFAIMFGDVVHGLLLVLFAIGLIAGNERLSKMRDNEIAGMLSGARYLLLLMGIFSIYTGLLYNDFLSRPANLFGSAWFYPPGSSTAVKLPGATYGFGVDPVWKDTQTDLPFYNSLKMKMSIIFGVLHMTVGLVMKLLNDLYFKNYRNVLFECIPEFLFLLGLFGYLSIVIFIKWFTDWTTVPYQAPSLINMLINFFLSPGSVAPDKQIYQGQAVVQVILLIILFLCIPVMLLAKPLLIMRDRKKSDYKRLAQDDEEAHPSEVAPLRRGYQADPDEDVFGEVRMRTGAGTQKARDAQRALAQQARADTAAGLRQREFVIDEDDVTDDIDDVPDGEVGHVEHADDEHPMSEIVVHQVIHTIEFVLGTVSNTASYLRLWALSLAHSQLATVFWGRILLNSAAWSINNTFLRSCALFVCVAVFFGTTMGVIMQMELLSAFLHALRLHWVEFQNKFYAGDGLKWKPFSFATAVHPEN